MKRRSSRSKRPRHSPIIDGRPRAPCSSSSRCFRSAPLRGPRCPSGCCSGGCGCYGRYGHARGRSRNCSRLGARPSCDAGSSWRSSSGTQRPLDGPNGCCGPPTTTAKGEPTARASIGTARTSRNGKLDASLNWSGPAASATSATSATNRFFATQFCRAPSAAAAAAAAETASRVSGPISATTPAGTPVRYRSCCSGCRPTPAPKPEPLAPVKRHRRAASELGRRETCAR